jgi:hypothetical protein
VAAHVRATLAAVQARLADPPGGRPAAPHVERALALSRSPGRGPAALPLPIQPALRAAARFAPIQCSSAPPATDPVAEQVHDATELPMDLSALVASYLAVPVIGVNQGQMAIRPAGTACKLATEGANPCVILVARSATGFALGHLDDRTNVMSVLKALKENLGASTATLATEQPSVAAASKLIKAIQSIGPMFGIRVEAVTASHRLAVDCTSGNLDQTTSVTLSLSHLQQRAQLLMASEDMVNVELI